MELKKPKLGIVSGSRQGKDQVGEFLGEITTLKYTGSLSQIVCPMIALDLGLSLQQAWETRHQNREFWKSWCDVYRKNDPARLIKLSLAKGDLVVGIRDKIEIEAAKEQNLLDLIIWVDRPGTTVDPTVTFTQSDADLIILNDGSLEDLKSRVTRLARCCFSPFLK